MERNQRRSSSMIDARTTILLVLLAVLTFVVFRPLTGYFFAQDDFQLMYNASFRDHIFLKGFFGSEPGQFRPLSKFLYFKGMYRLFDLDPFPYHVVSLIIYILNAVLFYLLLRRFRLSAGAAIITSSLFALNAVFINVVAWVSCIQQLLGQFFSLLFLITALAGLERRSIGISILSSLLYVAALSAIEQVFALPVVVLTWLLLERGRKKAPGSLRTMALLVPALSAMVAYAIFMLAWKGIPSGGPYAFHLGRNVLTNLLAYLHWAYDFSIEIPFLINRFMPGFSFHHILLITVVLYNLARGRRALVAAACIYYAAAILPVLFLENHTYLIHTYISSPALMLLLGWVVEDLVALIEARNAKAASAFPVVSMLAIALMCTTQVERNRNNLLGVDYPMPKDFVLRRALVAENAYRDMLERKQDLPDDGRVFLVYMGERSWYTDNVITALGGGSAVKLFYGKPRLEVFFHVRGDTLDAYTPHLSQILFYDHYGHLYTDAEVGKEGSAIGTIPTGR